MESLSSAAMPRQLTGSTVGWARVLGAAPLIAIVGVSFGLTALFVRSVHEFVVMPDELEYVKQSLAIGHSGFVLGPNSFYFNSWAQLLPLISVPIFGLLSMSHAFYVAHTMYAFLLASTAIPAYFLARELGLGKLAAYLVAALSVGVPWMVIAGEIMTDVVAYPVFTWSLLAMLRATAKPSVRRDLLALGAIAIAFFARTQFVALGPVLLVAIMGHELLLTVWDRGSSSICAALVRGARRAFVRHRVLWLISGALAAAVAVEALRGSSHSLLGNYVAPFHGSLLPAGTFSAGVEQLDGIVLGIGIVPFVHAAVWSLATVVRPRDPTRAAFAFLLVLTVATLLVAVGSFQTKFMGTSTTDRYLFYLVPALFVGAAAWVVDRRGSLVGTAVVTAAVIWMILGVGLEYLSVPSSINPSFNIDRVYIGQSDRMGQALGLGHLDARIPLALISSAFVGLALTLRARLSARAALLTVFIPVLAFVVLDTGYTMIKLNRQNSTIPAAHGAYNEWIDPAAPPDAKVGLLLAVTSDVDFENWDSWWEMNFWNKSVQGAFTLPGGDSYAQGPAGGVRQDLSHGRLTGLGSIAYLIKLASDPRLGLRGQVVTANGDSVLIRLDPGAPLTYGTWGVRDGGALDPSTTPFVRVFAPAGQALRERVTLTVANSTVGCPCVLRLGSSYVNRRLVLSSKHPVAKVLETVTIPAASYVQLDLILSDKTGRVARGTALVSVNVAEPGHQAPS